MGFDTLRSAQAQAHAEIARDMIIAEQASKDDLLGVESRLDARIDGVERRLDAKIDDVERRLDAKIDGLEARLEIRIEAGGEKLRADLTRTFVVTQLVSVCAILVGIALQVALATQR